MPGSRGKLTLAAIVLGVASQRTHAQVRTEIIRGRVTTDSGIAIPAATISATMAPDRNFFQALSDSAGRYLLIIPGGTGDYLVHVAAPGRIAFRKRITRDSLPNRADSVYVVDAKLASNVQQLAPVRVQAAKPKPSRSTDPGLEVGAADRIPDNFLGALPPELIGDVAATAATQPGILAVNGGFSVLGLGADQNSTTLNGMAFSGASLPRDAPVRVRVATATYDPSKGWFSGANVSLEAQTGGVYSSRRAHATLDAPALQFTDPVSARLGQRFTSLQGSIGGSGPVTASDRYFYSFGAQASRRLATSASLLGADADLLRNARVSVDSARRLVGILGGLGVPVSANAAPASLTSDNASLLARFDKSPYDWKTLTPSKTTAGVTMYGTWTRTQPLAVSPTSTPGHTGERRQGMGQIQALYSAFFGDDYLTETRSSVTVSRARSTPYLDLPDASVIVSSNFADGTGGVSALRFGGNGALDSDVRTWTWETTSELQLYPPGRSRHRVKISADSRFDGFDSQVVPNRLGSFTFNSLADLAANRPSVFTRTLSSPARTGQEWNGFAAIGDLWSLSRTFQLLYGARLEGNAFLSAPDYNPAVDHAFGARTDHAPNTWHASPRFGFTWVRRNPGNNGALSINRIGAFNIGPTSYLRGGIGEFRGMLAPSLLSGASAATGLPGGAATLACLGSAAPTPDWNAFSAGAESIPRQCAGGAPASTFSDAAPSVQLFDRRYTASRSWRSNLSYSSQRKRLAYSLDGTVSLGLSQPTSADLNFRNTPSFVLPLEGRPLFVPVTAIDAASGGVSSVPARVDGAFGRVVSNRSDGRAFAQQATITIAPDLADVSALYGSLSYTLSSIRSIESGFDGSTFGSPTSRAWGRAPLDARHQFLFRGGYAAKGVIATIFGRVQSGFPFTPIVGGDVNGDGLANDRAFVFDPAHAPDNPLGTALGSLVTNSSPRIRECLTRQAGAAAGRASCEGPWTAQLNAQLITSYGAMHLPRRISAIALTLTNPLGGIDQWVHGASHLRGWGTQPLPDPVLYDVRGFDQATSRFRYEVNPRFGNTNPSVTTLRAPFRITLDVSLDLGRPIFLQQLERSIKPGRNGYPGPRLTVAEIKRRYESTNIADPYASVLREADSLLLSRTQTEALQKVQSAYRQRIDTLWLGLATYLAALPDQYDAPTALARQEDAIASAREITRVDVRSTLPGILSPIQLRLLPSTALYYLRAAEPIQNAGRTIRP
ncbi:MAG: carboxypeptidase-like regulatory domain-containing protein [bacterium]